MNSDPWTSWVRTFDISDVSKHKNGFTIYKVISFLYPESCPDAVTKLVVWKRFNDFKQLHKDIKVLHKKYKIKDEVPGLPKSVIFKRYDEETINQRKRSILSFLDYIGNHAALFTSSVFVKFFETSHTPVDMLTSNINSIRADLQLRAEADPFSNSDVSDTDSFTSSNLESTAQAIDSLSSKSHTNLRKLSSMVSIDSQSSKASESFSIANTDNSLLLLDDPGSPDSFSEITQYLRNACWHVNMAIELEGDKQYEEAFSAYKTAVDILISGGKEDPNYDRRQMVRYKTEKYLIRAERIYNMYLAPEVKDLQLHASLRELEDGKPNVIKGPLYNLYKYKVIKIISNSGMLALHSEQQQVYYVKVLHKSVQFTSNQLTLPQNVPYMVKLVNHYNSDNAIFLVLEYCRGAKLRDILDNKTEEPNKQEQLLRNIEDQSDNESELSFSELCSAYAESRLKDGAAESDDGFEKVELDGAGNVMDQPLEFLEAPDLFSVQNTAKSRTLSEVSSFDSVDELDGKSSVSEQQIVKWAAQLIIALEKLHSQGVVCRDLKIEDLMIDQQDNVVLTYMCNFKELCELYSRDIDFDLAPEVYGLEEVNEAADWWSFGAILYELLVGVPLSKVHLNGFGGHTHLVIPKYVSMEGKSLLKQLLIYEPQERLVSASNGVQHLKSHPFFRSVNWSRL